MEWEIGKWRWIKRVERGTGRAEGVNWESKTGLGE